MESGIGNIALTVVSVALGGLISAYVTVVLSRRARFGELIRELGRVRQHFEGYPTGVRDAERALPKAIAFWRTVERTQWALHADGHMKAAREVSRLRQFAYWTALEVETIKVQFEKGSRDPYRIMKFQSEYSDTFRQQGFTRFEADLRSNYWGFFQPFPHPNLPRAGIDSIVQIPAVGSDARKDPIKVTQDVVACDGISSPVGHPRVYLRTTADGVACPYCDRFYVRR
jgi:uncharacterized Zn-finger protein